MRAGTKLGLYAVVLATIFVVGFAGARAFIPADAAAGWTAARPDHGTHHPTEMAGLSIEQDGYQIRDVAAPGAVGRDGTLSFRLTGPGGLPVTDYDTAHDKDLHLIVVRSDGAEFRHVHPADNGDGRWSMPWRWNAAGSYRLFADFVPSGLG